MAYEQIVTETKGRVGIIRLNRAEKLNAWTHQMSSEITDQMTKWNADPAIGAILMTGEGRAFALELISAILQRGPKAIKKVKASNFLVAE